MTARWKHHSTEEIALKLQRVTKLMAQGASRMQAVADIGVTDATYFRWRKRYAGLRPDQVSYVKSLEIEVVRLRRMISQFDKGLSDRWYSRDRAGLS